MSKERRHYTEEFKREAVELWLKSGKSACDMENELGITNNLLYRWKRALAKKDKAKADGSADQAAELRRLRRELELVKQERDILKKAVGIFSQPNE